jgi:hypothetical protein
MDDEIWRLIEADLDPLCEEGLIPACRDSIERYTELRRLLVPRLIGTPRDAKRLIGTFSILLRMLTGEVDWIDLLGFSALLAKAPLTVEQLKRDPDLVADDPTSMNEIVARVGNGQPSREVLLDRINPEREGGDDVRRLLEFLFPRLSDDRAGRRYNRRQGVSICKMRPLLTTLGLDLVPGYFSREQVLRLFGQWLEEVTGFLNTAYKQDRIGNFIAKLEDMSDELVQTAQEPFWRGVTAFVKKPDTKYLTAYSPMHEVVRLFAAIFFKIAGAAARDLFLKLVREGEVELSASLLRTHIFHHGLFSHKASDRDWVFLDGLETEAIARNLAARHRKQHLSGRFVWGLWSLNPAYTMISAGVWDEDCRVRLLDFLADPKAVDALTLMFYGREYTTTRETIGHFLDLDAYLKLVDERLCTEGMHESVRLGLKKAKEPIFG